MLLVTYAYGTNSGIRAVSGGGHGHGRIEEEIRCTARRHLTAPGLKSAQVAVANATFAARSEAFPGQGTTTAASDSTHFKACDRNFFARCHRYGGRGILVYWRDPLGPCEARASVPPSRHSRCHWQDGFRLTRSCRATLRRLHLLLKQVDRLHPYRSPALTSRSGQPASPIPISPTPRDASTTPYPAEISRKIILTSPTSVIRSGTVPPPKPHSDTMS